MAISDPIADMLTCVRNAASVRKAKVRVRRNGVCLGIARVLKEEGFINDFLSVDDGKQGEIVIDLKYGDRGEMVLQHIQRASKPGGRVYKGCHELPRVLDGLGISVISTSQGVMSDRQCRAKKIGGEVLCTVW